MVEKKVVLCFLFFMLLVPFSYAATGVTPGKYQENFEPGLSKEYGFRFFFEKERNVEFLLEGPLKEYATIIHQESDFDYHTVRVRLNLPQSLENPGENRLIIKGFVPEGLQGANGGTIEVKLSVASSVRVFVPYPGKYASVSLKTEDVNEGENIPYRLEIKSLGSESITVSPLLEASSSGVLLKSLPLGTITIPSQGSHTYEGILDGSLFKAGDYNLTAFIDYDGEQDLIVTDIFRIGELRVELINYTKSLEKNKVNPINLEFESFWNDPIDELYTNYRVVGSPEFEKSRSISLEPWKKNNIIIFFDTTEIERNDIDLELEMHYEGETKYEIITLKVAKEINWTTVLLIVGGIIGVLIIVALILLVLYLLKKQHGKKKEPKKE